MKAHVTGLVTDGDLWMSGGVVEEVDDFVHCIYGGVGLLGGYFTKGDKHGEIKGDGDVKEGSDNLLDFLFVGARKWGFVVVIGGKLGLLTVGRFGPFVGSVMFAMWMAMLELVEGMLDVPRHGDVNMSILVVPNKREAQELGAGEVGSDFVEVAKGGDEVVEVLDADIFNAEVVDNQGESDIAGFVAPERRSVSHWCISIGGEVLNKAIICNATGLF